MAIMNWLLQNGWDWTALMNARQAWGWFGSDVLSSHSVPGMIQLMFSTDAGIIGDDEVQEEAREAVEEYWGVPTIINNEGGWGQSNVTFAPNFKYEYGDPENPEELTKNAIDVVPFTPTKHFVQPERPDWLPEGLYPLPQKKAGIYDPNDPTKQTFWSCFGFLNGKLYLGYTHHMAIMNALLVKGWTWEDLMNAEQVWGWLDANYTVPIVNFSTDAGMIGSEEVKEEAIKSLNSYFGTSFTEHTTWGQSNQKFAPQFDMKYGPGGYKEHRLINIQEYERPKYFNQPERQDWMPEGLYPLPTKKSASVPRVCWLWDQEVADILMTDAHPNASHSELAPDFMLSSAAGDFHLYDNNTARGRLLGADDLTDEEKSYIIQRAVDLFRSQHPYHELTEIDDYTERGTPSVKVANFAMEPQEKEVGGYTLIEMSSGEYPTHDALMIDRANKIIWINYEGHHGPIFDRFGTQLMYMDPDQSAQGHWRIEDSRTESYKQGWGWHGGYATDEEQELIEQALREHYGVDDIQHSFLNYEPVKAEQPKLFEAKWSWLDAVSNVNMMRPHPWKAIYKPDQDTLLITEDISLDLHGETEMQGFYTKIERTHGPHVARAKELMEAALVERYPTMKKVAYGYIRWIIDRENKVTVGSYNSHAEMLEELYNPAVAESYDQDEGLYFDLFVTGGYISPDGIIEIVRSVGEEEFDAEDVAMKVYKAAEEEGYFVNGSAEYHDLVDNLYRNFNLFE